jgi:hypothetical protein
MLIYSNILDEIFSYDIDSHMEFHFPVPLVHYISPSHPVISEDLMYWNVIFYVEKYLKKSCKFLEYLLLKVIFEAEIKWKLPLQWFLSAMMLLQIAENKSLWGCSGL